MATRKKVDEDMLPHCKDCKFGEFKEIGEIGDCHYYPMVWIEVRANVIEGIEGGTFPMWGPAEEDGYCSFFQRKVH